MDRRDFVVKTALGAGALTTVGCGGGSTPSAVALTPPDPLPGQGPAPAPPASGSNGNEPRQYLSWDAGSGPSRDYWSQKLQLPWVHPGTGDWLDASQLPQGATPFASATAALGSVTLVVTDLVNRWLSTGANRGFYVRSAQDWPTTFAGRTHTTPRDRPTLTIETERGTIVLDCICNASWTPTSYLGRDSRSAFSVAAGVQFAALHFDLSNVTGPIRRATLALTCVSLKYPGALEVFELNPPEFRVGRGTLTAETGIARNFVFDQGLSGHPSVLFAGDFSDLSRARWQTGTVASGSLQVKDQRTGTTYLRSLIPEGDLLGCDLERTVVGATSAGITEKTETTLYARYYVFLEDDWGSEIDANKMPGWDGRLGWWSAAGYWQNTTGNGGVRPTGLKVRNTTANRWEYEGASMRGHGGTRSNDGNPYDDLFWLGSYIYHLDQVGDYGEPMRWDAVVIDKGRWHCIEQYIQMNSITGPFDATGNGLAVRDGQYLVWMDGVPAFKRTNLRWRRHPEMGIQGFWLNWYHGGTAASPRNMHFRMDSLVIARAYIGPRNEVG